MPDKTDRSPSSGKVPKGPRCIAIVGPFGSGKTTLLEAVLSRMGAAPQRGSVTAGTSIGDGSAEARRHRMSVELNVASLDFLGDRYTVLDCPGSVEFLPEMAAVLPVVDAAVVVCDADEKKVPALELILRELERQHIPRLIVLNKIEALSEPLQAVVERLGRASRIPLLLRQIPLQRDGATVGFVDLALDRAFRYREGASSEAVAMPDEVAAEEKQARFDMLERLSEHDDRLMEELLEEVEPEPDRVFADLAHEVQDGLAVPVLIGSALTGNGVERLMKALRHEVPGIASVAARLGLGAEGEPVVQVIKTLHTAHAGKLSLARVLRGTIKDGAVLAAPSGETGRITGIARLMGGVASKLAEAAAGDTVALGRLDAARTGDSLSGGRPMTPLVALPAPVPVMALAIHARDRKDEVKLGAALRKLAEEDRAIAVEQDPDGGALILRGQGEMHLRVAVERLQSRFGVATATGRPKIGFRETIRKPAAGIRGRHKKQSGGHGQFGDVVIDVAPLPRGEGFVFEDRIVGGVVPRNYIPAVENGIREALKKGPLGFAVVDVSVALVDGSFHTVDSSDMAFALAGRLAMMEALPGCAPVLLEPVLQLEIAVPSSCTARVNAIVASRRGQLLGYDAREGWDGWDCVKALLPEAETADLIVELRSITSGVGTFEARLDHLAEFVGRDANQVIAARQQAAAP